MENMEMVNEVISNDAVENLSGAGISSGSAIKTGLAIGGAMMVVGAVLWDRVAKPVGKRVRTAFLKRKAAKAKKPVKADSNTTNVDEVPPIE